MFQKWIRILMILGVLFSYFPAMPFEHCPEASHEGNHHEGSHHEGSQKEEGKLNCGYIFHCPFTFNPSFSEPLVILNTEKLVSVSSSISFGDFRFPVFHPPEEKV
jgi:hypothetical protein